MLIQHLFDSLSVVAPLSAALGEAPARIYEGFGRWFARRGAGHHAAALVRDLHRRRRKENRIRAQMSGGALALPNLCRPATPASKRWSRASAIL